MGVLWAFINLDRGEFVMPSSVNLKTPDEPPYSAFCIWLMQGRWYGDRVMFMGDNDDRLDGWTSDESRDKSDEYWKEFEMESTIEKSVNKPINDMTDEDLEQMLKDEISESDRAHEHILAALKEYWHGEVDIVSLEWKIIKGDRGRLVVECKARKP